MSDWGPCDNRLTIKVKPKGCKIVNETAVCKAGIQDLEVKADWPAAKDNPWLSLRVENFRDANGNGVGAKPDAVVFYADQPDVTEKIGFTSVTNQDTFYSYDIVLTTAASPHETWTFDPVIIIEDFTTP